MSGPKCDVIEVSMSELSLMSRIVREREELEKKRVQSEREVITVRWKESSDEMENSLLEEEKRRLEELDDAYDRKIAERILALEQEDREREEREREERKQYQIFEDAVVDYEAAANLAGVSPVHYEFSPETAGTVIEKLREECEKLRKQALDAACSRRVDELIDQTVEDMGYHLLGTRETSGTHRAVSKLYRYDENTALHVIGVDGQFTMEVVAVDRVDREPTEKEKERLEGSMERFCGDYERIMGRLEQTGKLNIKPVFHMPVNKKYASVINKTAYRKEEKKKRGMIHGADYMSKTGGNESVRKSAK